MKQRGVAMHASVMHPAHISYDAALPVAALKSSQAVVSSVLEALIAS